MITKPHFNRFRVGELLQFNFDTISICDKNDPVKLVIADKLNLFRSDTQGLDIAFNLVTGSSLSAEIAALAADEVILQRAHCITAPPGTETTEQAVEEHRKQVVDQRRPLLLRQVDDRPAP